MSRNHDRRAQRFRVELPVKLVGTRNQNNLTASNISRGGIFIQTQSPKPQRQLLRLSIEIEPSQPPVEVHGMVVHSIAPTNGNPGMGIEFIAFGGEPRERWEAYLRSLVHLSSSKPPTPDELGTPPISSPGSSPRHQPPSPSPQSQINIGSAHNNHRMDSTETTGKHVVRTIFPIPVQKVEQLYDIYERDLVAGSMFVCTKEHLDLGNRVCLRIIHPCNQEKFDLHGKVRKIHTNPQYPGLSIALRPSTLQKREQFREYIEQGIPETEFPLELVCDD